MSNKSKYSSALWWIFSFILMLVIAYYQTITGPTYPVRGKVSIGGELVKFKLKRSYSGEGDAPVKINVKDTGICAMFSYKRFKSFDKWTTVEMTRDNDTLKANIPHQPPAGKVEYYITLTKGSEKVSLSDDPVILRFRGDVPAYIMLPHIILMFLVMVLSTRAGIEALRRGNQTYLIANWTLLSLLIGGIILGPLVQQFAFGSYWTGWPVGKDLTDNKTAVALIFWIIAIIKLRKNNMHRGWVVAASIILLTVYLIPHSFLGSEIDHTKP